MTVTSDGMTAAPAVEVEDGGSFHGRYLWLLTAGVALALWVRPLIAPLWVDELGTWWVIKDGLGDVLHRAATYQGQSPLYYVVAWFARAVGGSNVVVLRLPSLLAAAGAAYMVYLLARRLFGVEIGRLAILVFVAWPGVSAAATDARPYALALLLVVGSTLALVRWLDTGQKRHAAAFAISATLIVYAHYVFGLVLLPQCLYAIVRVRASTTKVRQKDLVVVACVIVTATIPVVAQLASLWGRRQTLLLVESPSVPWLTELLVPPAVVGALVLGGALAAGLGPITWMPKAAPRSTFVLLFGWLFIPLFALLTLSLLTPVRLLSIRYTLSAAPAAIILVAWVMGSIRQFPAHRVIAALLAILSVLALGSRLKYEEDWRGATDAVKSVATADTVVLVHPALVESAQLDWFDDAERRSYLLSPLSYYPVPGRVVLVPFLATPESEEYLSDVLSIELRDANRVVLLSRFPGIPFRAWLDGRLGALGWSSRTVGSFGVIEVVEYTRPIGSEAPTGS